MEDAGALAGPALRRDPGDVAVDDEDDIGGRDGVVDAVAQAEGGAVLVGEAQVAAAGVEHAQARDGVGEGDEFVHGRVVAPAVADDEERRGGVHEGGGERVHGGGGQGAGAEGGPVAGVEGVGLELLFHGFARAVEVDGAGGAAGGELQGPTHHLLDVAARLDLARVAAVLADDLFLVRHVLDPVDVFGAGAAQLAFDRVGAEAGEDEDGRSAARGVVDGCAETLGSDVDVDDDALGLGG